MTTHEQPEDRWQTIIQLWRDERFTYQLLGGALLVGIGIWLGTRLFDGDPGYVTNLYTEVLSIGVTVFILDLLARRREERRDKARLKADLIIRMGSRVNETAVSAANELRARGWMRDGSLNDEEALVGANLQGALLDGAGLQGTLLAHAHLKKSYLGSANLRGAHLAYAKLQGANLEDADLLGADLMKARFDENTTLPDGQKWSRSTDMTRFTDPSHPNFWRPEPGSVWWYSAEDSD